VSAGSAGHCDGLEFVELVTELPAGFSFEEFRHGHGFAERQVHGRTFTISVGLLVATARELERLLADPAEKVAVPYSVWTPPRAPIGTLDRFLMWNEA
jgi:hypothetical protein